MKQTKPTTIGLVAIAWVPIVVLSFFASPHITDEFYLSLVKDVSVHARLLLAFPLLLVMEPVFKTRFEGFMESTSSILPEEHSQNMRSFFASTRKYFESRVVLVVIALVVMVLLVFFRFTGDYTSVSWAHHEDGSLTLAGWWYYLVSTTMFLTILLRWIVRWMFWVYVIFKVSRSPLQLIPEHADSMAGLEYLNFIPSLFSWVLCALSIVGSGMIAVEIMGTGAKLSSYYMDIAIYLIFSTLVLFAPLVLFLPRITQSQEQGITKMGNLIRKHHQAFEDKWYNSNAEESILGSTDPSSKADIDGSYAPLQSLQPVPVNRKFMMSTVAKAAIPFLPLLLVKYSLTGLLKNMLDMMMG